MKPFAIAFAIQALSYFILTLNIRAIAHEHYVAAGLTALSAAFLSYTIIKRIAQDESQWQVVAGMMLGGALADMAGIFATKQWGQ